MLYSINTRNTLYTFLSNKNGLQSASLMIYDSNFKTVMGKSALEWDKEDKDSEKANEGLEFKFLGADKLPHNFDLKSLTLLNNGREVDQNKFFTEVAKYFENKYKPAYQRFNNVIRSNNFESYYITYFAEYNIFTIMPTVFHPIVTNLWSKAEGDYFKNEFLKYVSNVKRSNLEFRFTQPDTFTVLCKKMISSGFFPLWVSTREPENEDLFKYYKMLFVSKLSEIASNKEQESNIKDIEYFLNPKFFELKPANHKYLMGIENKKDWVENLLPISTMCHIMNKDYGSFTLEEFVDYVISY